MIPAPISRWLAANRVLVANASSLVGTTLVTSALGIAYWWVAARQSSHAAVGLGSAAISSMSLLGSMSVLGLGTLLVTELPRRPAQTRALIVAASLVAGLAGLLLGALFTAIAPLISEDFRPLASTGSGVLLFSLGVSLAAITTVFDQAMIGLLQGKLQFWRNGLFALTKLAALLGLYAMNFEQTGLAIYATWLVGNLISWLALLLVARRRKLWHGTYRIGWETLAHLMRATLGHHAFNIALQAPILALPLVVTATLSASVNASFYMAWMLAGFAFVVPAALTTTLHATTAADISTMRDRIRQTLRLSLLGGLLANALLLAGAGYLLRLFGNTYAEQASWCLRILGLAVFPLSVRSHFVAICRVKDRVLGAALWVALGGLLELALAAAGGAAGGLVGLAAAWLAAVTIEAALMGPQVYAEAGFRFAGFAQRMNKQSIAR